MLGVPVCHLRIRTFMLIWAFFLRSRAMVAGESADAAIMSACKRKSLLASPCLTKMSVLGAFIVCKGKTQSWDAQHTDTLPGIVGNLDCCICRRRLTELPLGAHVSGTAPASSKASIA